MSAKKIKITGLEANLLLFGLDPMIKSGRCKELGYSDAEVSSLRDRLFRAHEHPRENEDGTFIDKVE